MTRIMIMIVGFMIAIGMPRAATAGGTIVGVNVVDVQKMSQVQQAALLSLLSANHVSVMRLDLAPQSIPFIINAARQGISSIAIMPFVAGQTHARPADPTVGLSWKQAPLSDPDTAQFKGRAGLLLGQLDAAHVKLAAIELGNEINNPQFNGDFVVGGTGQVFQATDLEAGATPETAAIRAGYRAYLAELTVLKGLRDASNVNGQTPLLSAGLADPGLPGTYAGRRLDAVSIAGTLDYLKANGLDSLVDGYGVHVYPSNDPKESLAQRSATLERDTFAACRPGGKPCWLTEWGFTNKSKSCPLDDATRAEIVGTMHRILASLAASGRLKAAIYYSWSGHLNEPNSAEAIFRCGTLTQAGAVALSPF